MAHRPDGTAKTFLLFSNGIDKAPRTTTISLGPPFCAKLGTCRLKTPAQIDKDSISTAEARGQVRRIMRVIFSKTDALGDQLFASGYLKQILTHIQPDLLVWFVRRGYEAVSALFKGSRVFVANPSADPRQ